MNQTSQRKDELVFIQSLYIKKL